MNAKSICLSLFAVLLFNGANSQVVLTSTQMPQPGTVLYFSTMAQPDSFQFQHSGGGLVWDFSQVPYSGYDSVVYLEPSATQYGSNFPDANLSVSMGTDGYGYIFFNDNYSHLIGIAGDAGYGVMPVPLNPPLVLFNFPYTFGTMINSTAKAVIKGTGAQFGMPFDSVKLVSTINTQRSVDGWGTLILRCGTYEGTLLEKTITNRIDSAFAKVVFLGWTPIPGFPLSEVDSSYNWITGESTHPYASISYDVNGISTGGSFYAGDITSSKSYLSSISELKLIPNPVKDYGLLADIRLIKDINIYDMQGRLVMRKEIHSASATVNFERLKPGIYLLKVMFSDGSISSLKFTKN
ncbi:MAG: hypothetical protein PWR20_237 [Bacteroidales bacterium]|jgi:hypothetical protein|nr:hypothetical protein [Bacteroidales bacterium]MDN5328401.1 hypothetical protein [Bacteroidales bacterium]